MMVELANYVGLKLQVCVMRISNNRANLKLQN